jgi:hypothetical protein
MSVMVNCCSFTNYTYPSMAASAQQVDALFAQFEDLIVAYAAHPDDCDRMNLLKVNVGSQRFVFHQRLNIHSLTSMRR